MKAVILFLFFSFLFSCSKHAKVTFDISPNMPKENRLEFEAICNKGKILWNMNCASCHNIKQGRKIYIPDFSQQQISGYEMRAGNKEHEANLSREQISAEELNDIITFLTYKSKSGVAFKPKN